MAYFILISSEMSVRPFQGLKGKYFLQMVRFSDRKKKKSPMDHRTILKCFNFHNDDIPTLLRKHLVKSCHI